MTATEKECQSEKGKGDGNGVSVGVEECRLGEEYRGIYNSE